MASIAETLISGQQRSIENMPQQMQVGAQIVSTAIELKRKKEALQAQQEQLRQAGYRDVNNAIVNAAKISDKKARNTVMKEIIPQYIKANGLQNEIDPNSPGYQSFIVSEEALQAFPLVLDKVVSGTLPQDAVAQYLTDPFARQEFLETFGAEIANAAIKREGYQFRREQFEAGQAERGERRARQTRRDIISDQNTLRDDLRTDPVTKLTTQRADSFDSVLNGLQAGNAAGDLAGIFAFMKMLDPGSTVREGEFANAQNAAGVPDMVLNAYNRVIAGERLNPKQRKQFLNQARTRFERQVEDQAKLNSSFEQIAKQQGLSADAIIPQNLRINQLREKLKQGTESEKEQQKQQQLELLKGQIRKMKLKGANEEQIKQRLQELNIAPQFIDQVMELK